MDFQVRHRSTRLTPPAMAAKRFYRRLSYAAASPLVGTNVLGYESGTGPQKTDGSVPKKALGRTGVQVSALGVGGYHLGSTNTDQLANDIVAKALDHGIDFFDNAWEYHDGLSEERLGRALKGKRERAFLMTKV
jgi:uncharacterized protein